MAAARHDDPMAHAIRLFQSGKIAEAGQQCAKLLRRQPRVFSALYLLGVIREQEGDRQEAIALFRRALAIEPRSPDVLTNLGIALLKSDRCEDAIEALGKAIAIDPTQAVAHDCLGLALNRLGRRDAAVASFRQALAIRPDLAEAHLHLGSLLVATGDAGDAVASLRAAIRLNPALADAHFELGTALLVLRQIDAAVDSLRRAIALNPAHVEARRNLGLAMREAGQPDLAIESFQAALKLNPGHVPALNSLGNLQKRLGAYDAAIAAYTAVLEQDPRDANALSMSAYLRRSTCDWTDLAQIEERLIRHVRDDSAPVMPFPFLAITDDPDDQLRCARQFWRRPRAGVPAPIAEPPGHQERARLRVGYLSADLHAHATAYLMAQLFEQHDRSQFEVFAFSYGPDDSSPMRQRLVAAFDEFFDIRGISDAAAARLIREQGVDILIDLKGHTEDARLEILAARPAPVQAHYIGYPGTIGADCVDYVMADHVVVRPEEAACFAEQIVYLPFCYQVNDRLRQIDGGAWTRAGCGLPDSGFVFCNFNNSYKITPALFDVWMGLLHQVPGSALWLLSDNQWAEQNLRREADRRGMAAERLVFAPRVSMEQHLGRHALADLFLDTSPYTAHTTASDALWARLPLLTFPGRSFASRVAASLLHAMQLPELVARDIGDYSRRAVELANDPGRVATLREILRQRLPTSALFDTAGTRRDLEAAYREMWEVQIRGDPVRSFQVERSVLDATARFCTPMCG